MKKAIIYLRVSTDNQEYERQLYDLKTLAKRWDYDITAIYEEKRSAVKGMETRDELTKLRQLTKDDVDVILMWDITRLSRKAVDFIALINEFANKGICLHFFDRNIITLENDGSLNLMTQMYLYILGVFAQMDAENLKIKMESGKENALRNGNSYTSQAPLGYKIVDKKLVIDEEEAGSIRLIFKMYSEGKPLQEIADDFNARKIESRTKVNKWDKNVFYTILTNTAYYGKGKRISKNHGERFFDCPAIISKELFDLCRNVANKNKTNTDKSRKTDNLLRGLLKCGECNKSYILRNGSAGAAYGCSDNGSSVNNKLNCEGGTSNVAKTDAVIWEAIKEIYFKESFKEKTLEEKLSAEVKINDNNRLILHYETEIKENNKKLDKARSGYINGLLDDAFLHKVNNEVSSDTLRCNNNIDQLKADNLNLRRNIDEQSNFDEIINTELSHEEKKNICSSLIKEIFVYKRDKWKKIYQMFLKNGMVINIITHNTHAFKYYILDNNDIQFIPQDQKMIETLPDDLKDNMMKEFIINDYEDGEYISKDYSVLEVWEELLANKENNFVNYSDFKPVYDNQK